MDENPTNTHVMNIYKELNKLTTDVSLLCERQQVMAKKIDEVYIKIGEYGKRFDKIDNLAAYKGSWFKGFERNWWKILLVLTPVCIGLFEAAVWLKNLPVPTL